MYEFDEAEKLPEEVQALASECENLNREYHDNDADIAEKINRYQERAAQACAQRNQDEATFFHKQLQALRDGLRALMPEPPPPPLWAVIKTGWCLQILELMRKAQENGTLPSPLRKKMEGDRGPDSAKVAQIERQMGPETTEEEARAAAVELRPIHKRWEYYTSIYDTF